jgi:hypothetical protein
VELHVLGGFFGLCVPDEAVGSGKHHVLSAWAELTGCQPSGQLGGQGLGTGGQG